MMCIPKNCGVIVWTPAAWTVIANCELAVWGGAEESATCTVKLNEPLWPVVPETSPLAALRWNPAGRVPDSVVHVYGCIPPDAASVCEYAVPSVVLPRLAAAITSGSGGMMVTFTTAWTLASATVVAVTFIVFD